MPNIPPPDHPLLARQQDGNPCPSLNGTTIGSVEQFRLFCDSRIEGTDLEELDASSMQQCVEFCSSFHPRCFAVTFNGSRCRLKTNIVPDDTRPSRFLDSAAGLGPAVQPFSNCNTFGGNAIVAGKTFGTFCDKIVDGNDIEQQHSTTMEDCLGRCAANPQCGGVSFDASLRLGFRNCYLKTAFDPNILIDDAGIDSAVVNGAANPNPVVQQPAPPVTVTRSGNIVTLTAAPPQPVEDETAPLFSITGFSTLVGAPSFLTLTEVIESTVTTNLGAVNDVPITQVLTIPVGSTTRVITNPAATMDGGVVPTDGADGGGTQQQNNGEDGGGDNLAWVAAPVIGGVAAILLVVVMFVLWGKKRKAARMNSPGMPPTPMSPWVPPFIGNYWRAWSDKKNGVVRLESPPASRGGLREKSGGASGEGEGSGENEREGGGSGSGSGSGRGATASVYEVLKDGRLELRDSANGLRLNAPILEQLSGARLSANVGKAA